MAGEPTLIRTSHGSYVQLNTIDEKEDQAVKDAKNSILSTRPYKRCLCTKRDIVIVTIVLVGAFILISTTLALGLPKLREKRLKYLDPSFRESSTPLLTFDEAVVVTDAQPCAAIGKGILFQGGSAVDAAIATLFCNGVVNPQSMGLGGGFFMTVYTKEDGRSEVIDAREVAPLKASSDMFNGSAIASQEGGLSIAVPGELKGYWEAYRKYHKLMWSQLVQPSVELCNNGFVVGEHLAKKLQTFKNHILSDPTMKKEFFNNKTNDLYKVGEVMKRPVLGTTLSEVATKGADALYIGDLQAGFLKDIANCGGIINATDLANYRVNIKPAVKAKLDTRNLTLHSVPPPGNGPILSLIMNVLSFYNMTSADFENLDDAVLMYHRIVETFKFAFAHRTRLGDAAFVNVAALVEQLQSKEYAKSIWKRISDVETFPSAHYEPAAETNEDHGTAQVSVVAANGDAVSVTSSVNTYFGSLCMSPSTGIILNNGMDGFSIPGFANYFQVPPSPANFIAPGKRPLSSMCPSILVNDDGDVEMVVGGAGGTRIITASALALVRTLWLSDNIKNATDAPRIHHQLFPNYIQYEKSFPKVYLDKLEKFGHKVQPDAEASVFLGILKKDGKFQTNVDFRKGGSAEGY